MTTVQNEEYYDEKYSICQLGDDDSNAVFAGSFGITGQSIASINCPGSSIRAGQSTQE
jgi:hypothetical protein